MMPRNPSTSRRRDRSTPLLREQPSTADGATARRTHHNWRIGLIGILFAAACGGHGHGDAYGHATSQQEKCCENLQGDARDQCMQQIVRVDDPGVASSAANQDTYRCIEDHFVCDPSTGHASTESAQAQYDCIAALPQ